MMPGHQARGRRRAGVALLLIVIAALGLRLRGVEWPLLHPDEYKISAWASWMEEHTRTANPAYPGGYFHLVQPLLKLKNAALDGCELIQTFMGHGDSRPRPEVVETFLLREINVVLALLTILLLYALARRVTASRAAALAAAAFLGLSRLHVEHSHYAETDIAMLFTFTLALYLWARVSQTRRVRWFLLAAGVTGLAIGTKYINLILIGNLVAGIVLCGTGGEPRARRLRWGVLVVAGIALTLAGWVYTNRHVMDGASYWQNLSAALQRTYGERTGLQGLGAGDAWAPVRANLKTFAEGVSEISVVWLGLAVAGLGLALTRRFRSYGTVTLLPLGLYLVYFIKVAPWVRSQEFMVFLPLLGLLIAMSVAKAWSYAGRWRHPVAVRSFLIALLAVATLQSAVSAGRFASLCGWPEPRIQAMKWLYCHAPLEARVAVEDYTVPPCRLFGEGIAVDQIEWVAVTNYASKKAAYLLRNETATGRGTIDPRTSGLYPEYAANLAAFRKSARLLCEWGPDHERFTFAGHRIEWWDTHEEVPGSVTVETPMFRPVRIDESDAVCVPLDDGAIGSASCMMVDTQARTFVVSGAGESRRTLYVVLQTEERGGTVEINAMGARSSIDLAPYSARVVSVQRPWYWPKLSDYDTISVRLKPQPHIRLLPCFVQVATDPGEVATLFFQKGFRDRALARLAAVPPDSEKEKWLRYVCAIDQRDWEFAGRFEKAARKAYDAFEAWRTVPVAQQRVNGKGAGTFLDHARIRMPGLETGRTGLDTTEPAIPVVIAGELGARLFTGKARLPVRLVPGRYHLKGTLRNPSPAVQSDPWTLQLDDGSGAGAKTLVMDSGKACPFETDIVVEREQTLTLAFTSSQGGGRLEVSGLELRWGGDDLLQVQRRELLRAFILDAFHRGDEKGAAEWLGKARASIPDPGRWERVERTGRLMAVPRPLGRGTVFYPWLRLAGAKCEGPRCRLRFEVAKESPPPLRVQVVARQGKRVVELFKGALPVKGRLQGEEIAVDVPVPAGQALQDIGVRVEADEEWISTPLRVRGVADGRVWLQQ